MSDLIGQSLGRYHILEQLGEGGMATVYKAYDTRLETDVAVKVIRTENLAPSVLERSLKRFEREAKSLAKLTHPNIVKVTDYGEFEGKPYLVMPYLPGGTLKDRIKQGPIPWQEAVRLLLPIAQALEYAHKQNVIHRDVKPSNILLTESGQPMLTDFGVAKILQTEETQELTGTGVGIGTPEYMAPEQATAKTADHRADIYALGVVLYEMVAGRKPYAADTPMAVLIMHARDPLPRPSQFVRDLPENLEKNLLKALAKKPEDRYRDMYAFEAALEQLLLIHQKQTAKVARPNPVTASLARRNETMPAYTAPVNRTVKALKPINLSARQIKFTWIAVIVFVCLFALWWIARQPVISAALRSPGMQLSLPFVEKPTSTATFFPTLTSTPTLIPTATLSPTPDPRKDARIASVQGSQIKISDGTGKFLKYIKVEGIPGVPNPWDVLSWSPDGTQLVFQSERNPNGGDIYDYDLYILNLQDYSVIHLTSSANNLFPSWSPDGKYIAFHRSCQTVLISPVSKSLISFWRDNLKNHCASLLRWSPDSQWLAVYSDSPSGRDNEKLPGVGFANLITNKTVFVRMTSSRFIQNDFYQMAWSPDGKLLYLQFQISSNLSINHSLISTVLDISCLPSNCTDADFKSLDKFTIPPSWLPNYHPQWQQ